MLVLLVLYPSRVCPQVAEGFGENGLFHSLACAFAPPPPVGGAHASPTETLPSGPECLRLRMNTSRSTFISEQEGPLSAALELGRPGLREGEGCPAAPFISWAQFLDPGCSGFVL